MKVPPSVSDDEYARDRYDDRIREFNRWQIEINRKEAGDVKGCFSSQAHQAMIASAAIMGFASELCNRGDNWYVFCIASLLVIVLCLATASVGCHKYATANRSTAYQIHLARTLDYAEHGNTSAATISQMLRRIDWEEAMFAWRIVQPTIYECFYSQNRHLGLCLKRFKYPMTSAWIDRTALLEKRCWTAFWDLIIRRVCREPARSAGAGTPQKGREMLAGDATEYPWHDSKELLRSSDFETRLSEVRSDAPLGCQAQFYPGKYLRKMLFQLNAIVIVSLFMFVYSVVRSYTHTHVGYAVFGFAVVACIFYYVVVNMANNYWRCRVLESGLLSIQTSAFVWRIVCVVHLVALLRAAVKNKQDAGQRPAQVYKGYTAELAIITCAELYKKLNDPHKWLAEAEEEILGLLPEKGRNAVPF